MFNKRPLPIAECGPSVSSPITGLNHSFCDSSHVGFQAVFWCWLLTKTPRFLLWWPSAMHFIEIWPAAAETQNLSLDQSVEWTLPRPSSGPKLKVAFAREIHYNHNISKWQILQLDQCFQANSFISPSFLPVSQSSLLYQNHQSGFWDEQVATVHPLCPKTKRESRPKNRQDHFGTPLMGWRCSQRCRRKQLILITNV